MLVLAPRWLTLSALRGMQTAGHGSFLPAQRQASVAPNPFNLLGTAPRPLNAHADSTRAPHFLTLKAPSVTLTFLAMM